MEEKSPKLSELIEALQQEKEQWGDVPLVVEVEGKARQITGMFYEQRLDRLVIKTEPRVES